MLNSEIHNKRNPTHQINPLFSNRCSPRSMTGEDIDDHDQKLKIYVIHLFTVDRRKKENRERAFVFVILSSSELIAIKPRLNT